MSGLNVSVDGEVARVVFDRPKALNALTPSMLRELIEISNDLGKNDAVKVVALSGAGDCFSAGADLPAFLPFLSGPDAQATADLGRLTTNAVADLPKITVAAVRGHCIGAGLVLAGACDIRMAADDARFMIPELDAGIPLGWGAIEHLIRLVGETLAADLVLSCRPLDAAEAQRSGLVSRVVPASRFEAELETLVSNIARKPQIVLKITKQQMLAVRDGSFDPREDANAMLSSLHDPEAIKVGLEYISKRIKKERAGAGR